MGTIGFSQEEKEVIIKKIRTYFTETLDQEIGRFDAEFLLDFFAEEVGAYFYNRGLLDAQAVLSNRLENISEAILELEKVTKLR